MLYATPEDNNKLVHIDSVSNGASCRCVCPECGLPVIAKQGQIYRHYFAHKSNLEQSDACTFNQVKSSARRLIELLESKMEIFVPNKQNIKVDESELINLQLTKVVRKSSIHRSFYDVTCYTQKYKPFDIRFKIDDLVDHVVKDETPKRFLLIDIYAFIHSFNDKINITDNTVSTLLVNKNSFKKGCNVDEIESLFSTYKHSVSKKSYTYGSCCSRSEKQGFDYCLICKREFD
jgi:hypothetical protein